MFVFSRKDLPAEPVFPADLEKLGYFITEDDQIRKISAPKEEFQFKINRNARWNEMQREAMNTCIRNIVLSRLRNLGLITLRLPLTARPTDAHVPILISKNLSTATRVIVAFGEPIQDLGIWAYRTLSSDGIEVGSAVQFARAVLDQKDTALVLANTGQLVWHCGSGQAMTLTSWHCVPRKSAVDPPLVMTRRNKIPGNGDWQEHIQYVFEEILAARGRLVRPDAKIGVVGLDDGGLGVIRYLGSNWEAWRPYISAICLTSPFHRIGVDFGDKDGKDSKDPSSFVSFVSSRCRGYILSEQDLGLPVPAPEHHGCNCYSSGEPLITECVMPKAWEDMLKWLNTTFEDPEYCEANLMFREFSGNMGGDAMERVAELEQDDDIASEQ
ncbi:Arb2 domain-containing protein [Aspergillus piperis CBS 112811]|uniref:Arb2 domain-containing protein n=1 Tax=Aspergillus piperis CBS 112811 TaxID=1448313 RepID=A0A8G1VH10_9EURO|nr:Arb2 domain-containing protein [Aspergillus piperis CBS 112811]RAH52849.1 Arb2 domain-containing protein [Aspergillus piperis CBS 112811]